MYKGDRARKENLVNYGFRLPSALDNRPLRFDEFERLLPQTRLRVGDAGRVRENARGPGRRAARAADRPRRSDADRAARGDAGRRRCCRRSRCGSSAARARAGHDADQAHGRGPDRLPQRARRQGALPALGHRDASSASRSSATCGSGEFDVLVGINLLREGLDIPEVSLVGDPRRRQGRLPARGALADPDHRPRGAHINGTAILYADRMTDSMTAAIGETERRRDEADRVQRKTRHHAERRARSGSRTSSTAFTMSRTARRSVQGRAEQGDATRR